jgi:putative ABC transport system permease protein
MLFWIIVKVALKSLLSNKLRSFLAMLGIIIGVGAVIAMLALGTGAERRILERVSAMGTDLLIVRPGQRGLRGRMTGTEQTLVIEDADAIVAHVANVKEVAPVVGGAAQLKYYNKNTSPPLVGTSLTYFPIRNFEIERGRAFTETEAERTARVAVLGAVTVEELFGQNDPIGETIKLKGINFRVIGVLKRKGDQGWFNPDNQAIIPYTTAMKQVLGLDHLREIDIQSTAGADITEVQNEIAALLRRRHRIQPGAEDDFHIFNQAELRETVESFSQTFTIMLGGIAGISLLVGGIGIMNIMLVTVTERTREIGVRKAVGARDRDILRQFLLESIIMSGLGGLMGTLLGYSAARVTAHFIDFSPVVTAQSVALSLGVAAGVGIFFGYYPARRAAKLDPIDSLRYE